MSIRLGCIVIMNMNINPDSPVIGWWGCNFGTKPTKVAC
ncbi:hypothetical protein DSUL_20058 [Desulfovibrionales bacterium]